MKDLIRNALTIDVEEWFQVAALSPYIDRDSWERLESRVETKTRRLLQILAAHNVKATFFILGWIAERHPQLVRDIAGLGHEIACHGFSHELIYRQTPEQFRSETRRAKQVLENIVGVPVEGYRAATYSITGRSLWALDILIAEGFRYDSSIFPVRHPQYGIPGSVRFPHVLTAPSGGQIIEFPLSTARIFGASIPVAGGGYFRQFPYVYTKLGLHSINLLERKPAIFYLHPWELDPEQPRIEVSLPARVRHYHNLEKTEARLNLLLRDFRFTTVQQVLKLQGLLAPLKFRTAA